MPTGLFSQRDWLRCLILIAAGDVAKLAFVTQSMSALDVRCPDVFQPWTLSLTLPVDAANFPVCPPLAPELPSAAARSRAARCCVSADSDCLDYLSRSFSP